MKPVKLLFLLALSTFRFAYAQDTLTVPFGGNAFSTIKADRSAKIDANGISNWRNANEFFTVYVRATKTGQLNITLDDFKATGSAQLAIEVDKIRRRVNLQSNTKTVSVGSFLVKDTGYIAIKVLGLKKQGELFPALRTIKLSGPAVQGGTTYVKGNAGDMYFGRRGPSTHLNYQQPKATNAEWFYNELTVPAGQDPVGSYFMAAGFAEGYFGIQVNSPTERRVLFSVWSPFTTDNPKEIPDDHRVKIVRKGDNVITNDFGGEGSGGQSYMRYSWKAGNTYKFLVRIRPIEKGYTEYKAYFFAPEENKWHLLAIFQRPKTQTYAKHLHSFLECFSPAMGDITRTGTYGNQWIADSAGHWTELTQASFSYDATAKNGYRKDYQGGIYPNNSFYLKIGGFFNDFTTLGQLLKRKPSGVRPMVDFAKLP